MADGGYDIHQQLDLSGEPLIPDLQATFKLTGPLPVPVYQRLTVEGRDYEASYSDYWNSTSDSDGTWVNR